MGVPAVATDVGGVREVLAGDPRSRIVPVEGSPDALFEATLACVRERGSRPAPEIAEAAAGFTFIHDHLSLYAQVMPRRRPSALVAPAGKVGPALLPPGSVKRTS
jgi:hypothetical protein